ncbi:MAG: hypothetical protein ACYTG7_10300 [Planctomycetota bacterium]|jgi:type IV secretory pathway VirB2 component (pilin)
MSTKTYFEGFRSFIKVNFITRITGIMLKGTLGQKVAVVIGCLGMLFGIYKTFIWILLVIGGYIIVFLAFKDYENMTNKSPEA